MTTVTVPQSAGAGGLTARRARAPHGCARFGLLRDLEHPHQVFEMLTPNWFASVMGTGIIAVAAARLPERFPGLHASAIGIWALATLLLIALLAATIVHWVRYPANALSHARHPVMAQFYGAVPMAMLTVGAATLLVGTVVVGHRVAIDADWVLWFAGTITGLVTAAAVPYLTFTRYLVRPDSAFGGWLMPIVPPMVSASTGALLLPYAPAGQARLDLLLCCYAMFGISLLASMIVITLIWYGLALHKTIGLAYGLPVLGFALLWAVIASMITIRTAREHLPFSLTWWSFTFPVGTCVTGTTALAVATGSTVLRITAAILFTGLAGAWLIVAIRTARGAATGHLFLAGPDPVATAVR